MVLKFDNIWTLLFKFSIIVSFEIIICINKIWTMNILFWWQLPNHSSQSHQIHDLILKIWNIQRFCISPPPSWSHEAKMEWIINNILTEMVYLRSWTICNAGNDALDVFDETKWTNVKVGWKLDFLFFHWKREGEKNDLTFSRKKILWFMVFMSSHILSHPFVRSSAVELRSQ